MRAATRALFLMALCPVGAIAEAPFRAPHHAIDHATACGLLQLTKEFHRAIEHCDAALYATPFDDRTLSNRGSAHYALGSFKKALDDFNAALQLKPQGASNFFNRALVHAAKRDHSRAIADYSEAIRLMPTLAIAYNNRAHEFEVTGERDKAIADYRMALRLAPALAEVIRHNLQRLGAEP